MPDVSNHRSEIPDLLQQPARRRWLIAPLLGILVFAILLCCGQVTMLFQGPRISAAAVSELEADYREWVPQIIGPVRPAMVADIPGAPGMLLQPSDFCFLIGLNCDPSPTPSPSPTPTVTLTPTNTASPSPTLTPSQTPTATNTQLATFTQTPTNTPLPTATPTPLVFPIKLANPGNIPPGDTSVAFNIIVINYGSLPPAELTAVIDRLPLGMTLAPGTCSPAGCTTTILGDGRQQITWILSVSIPQGRNYQLSFQANVTGTSAGDVLANEVETQGGNFQTSIYVRRVYVYTPTPAPVIPNAVDDTASVAEDASVTVNVLANDTGLRDAPHTVTVESAPSNGNAVANPSNTITYTPDPDWRGIDIFQYRVTDIDGDWDVGTVTVTVDPVNDVPLANDDLVTTNQDTSIDIDVLANDSGLADTPVSVSIAGSGPSNGTAVVLPGNTIRYTPNPGFYNEDPFQYTVSDSGLPPETSESSTATVTVQVNYIPVANDDAYSVDEDGTLSVPPPPDLLDNDVDNYLGTMTALLVTGVSDGSLSLNPDGSFDYTPNPDFRGLDSFTYRVSDGLALSNLATVTLDVLPVNDTPQAFDDGSLLSPLIVTEDVPLTLDVLANDLDLGDTPLSVTISTLPTNGNVSVVGSPGLPAAIRIIYTPNLHYNGTDEFEYTVTDSVFGAPEVQESSSAMVYLEVVEVNDPPIADNDSATTTEDAFFPVAIDVLDGDTDIDGDPIWIQSFSAPANGLAALNDNGTPGDLTDDFIDYTPNPDFRGPDSFTYQATDGLAFSNLATVALTVLPVNDVPSASADGSPTRLQVSEDTPLTIDVLSNDSGLGDTPLTVTIPSQPTNGTATVIGSPGLPSAIRIIYTPDPDYNGLDDFIYTVTDSAFALPEVVDSSSAGVFLNVVGVNDPPVAVDDPQVVGDYTIVEDSFLNVAAPGVLDNDTDIDNIVPDDLSAILVSDVSDGTLTLNPDGSFTYDPYADFFGTDSFTYRANDGLANSNRATVTITVNSMNDTPNAQDDTDFTNKDESVDIRVLDNDLGIGDRPLTVEIVLGAEPSNGTAVVLPSNQIRYTPNPGFDGTDTLDYRVIDVDLESSVATVDLIINDPPVTVPDFASVDEDDFVDIDWWANDTDTEDGQPDPTTLAIVDWPDDGSLVDNGDGTVTYTPDPDFYSNPSPDTFDYRVQDSLGAWSNVATVTITVNGLNDPPNAGNDSAWTEQNSPVNIPVLDNDNDLEAALDPASVSVVNPPSNGVAAEQADGSITYTPNPGYYGPDSFTYTVDDLGLPLPPATSNQALVSVTVNSPPVANDDPAIPGSYTINEDGTLNVAAPGVLSNDTDADFDPLQAVLDDDVDNGSLSLNANGSFVYTPDPDWNGTDSFSYWAFDGASLSLSTATVSLTVVSVDDFPSAVDDSDATDEDLFVIIDVLANDSMGNNPPPAPGDGLGSVVPAPLPGTVGTVAPAGGNRVRYTPPADWSGIDAFTYTLSDADGDSSVATVTVTVNPVNDPPVANDDSDSTDEDTPVTIDVWANDTDPEDGTPDPTTIVITGGPTYGTTSDNGDGTVTFTPDADFLGVGDPPLADSFNYTIDDSGGATSNQATVYLSISPVNDPPEANPDSRNTNQATPVNIPVLANDSDPESDPLSIATFTQGINGSVTLDNNGTPGNPTDDFLTYTPNQGPFTTDSFSYQVSDGFVLSNSTTVSIGINPPNLQIDKVAIPSTANLGDQISFTIAVWNDGPGIAYGVQLTDVLGSCFTWVGGSPNGSLGDIEEGGALVVLPLPVARVDAISSCDNTNTASVSSINGGSASDVETISFLPMGGGAALISASSNSETQLMTPTVQPTPTLSLTPTPEVSPIPTGTPEPYTATPSTPGVTETSLPGETPTPDSSNTPESPSVTPATGPTTEPTPVPPPTSTPTPT